MKNTGKPTAITMSIGPVGDSNNVSTGECAVKLARAGKLVNIFGVSLNPPAHSVKSYTAVRIRALAGEKG